MKQTVHTHQAEELWLYVWSVTRVGGGGGKTDISVVFHNVAGEVT